MCENCAKLIAENQNLRDSLTLLRDIINQSLESHVSPLTKSEGRLLGVLRESPKIEIKDACKLAGITRQTYYNAMNKEGFKKYLA